MGTSSYHVGIHYFALILDFEQCKEIDWNLLSKDVSQKEFDWAHRYIVQAK